MRVSEGVSYGRHAELFNPDLFREHEEVIVFTREEFRRLYDSIMMQMDVISKLDMNLERDKDWRLMGYWSKIMEHIHLIDLNIQLIFTEKPYQCYLDAYLYNTVKCLKEEPIATTSKVMFKQQLLIKI